MHEPGCYYTRNRVSDLLISQLQTHQPEHILDLGAGHGALLIAARRRWPNALLHAVEPHGQGHAFLRMRFPGINSQRLDGLDLHLEQTLGLEASSMDVAVCNPPYLQFANQAKFHSLFTEANLPSCLQFSTLSTDLVFLAQNLRLLKNQGELGIIVPDGLLTNHCFQLLREDLLSQHQLCSIIQLPEHIFHHTEARTHILVVRKHGTTTRTLALHRADRDGTIVESIQVNSADLVKRMDFQFWNWQQQDTKSSTSLIGLTLAELGAEIKRGLSTKNDYERAGVEYFHTSHFRHHGHYIDLPSAPLSATGLIAAQGDLLLARVGKRCIGHVGLVSHGHLPITDCVYRIRVAEPYRIPVLAALSGSSGQHWLKAYAHGVCAQVISKTDLLKFKI
ncbi:N-6 DNA methylase [Methylomonas sp. MgM2]